MLPVAGLSVIIILILVAALARERAQRLAERERAELQAATREAALSVLRAELEAAKEHERFLIHVLRHFPHFGRELRAEQSHHSFPAVLLKIVNRLFEPRQAAVLVRSESDASALVVAAAAPARASADLPEGTKVAFGTGRIGYVAEVQRLMGTADFDGQPAAVRSQLDATESTPFRPCLAAPMLHDDTTMGVIAVAGLARETDDVRAALQLVAHVGGTALGSAAAYRKVKHIAERDGLTGLWNKRRITELLGEELHGARERSNPLSLLLFDLDNFKHYNDTNGHIAGDRLLRELPALVATCLRAGDLFGRFGGEEFLIVMPRTPLPAAMALAYAVRAAIAGHPFAYAEAQPLGRVSVSGGVACYPQDGTDSTHLLHGADAALYAAKASGRDRVLPAPRAFFGEKALNPACT